MGFRTKNGDQNVHTSANFEFVRAQCYLLYFFGSLPRILRLLRCKAQRSASPLPPNITLSPDWPGEERHHRQLAHRSSLASINHKLRAGLCGCINRWQIAHKFTQKWMEQKSAVLSGPSRIDGPAASSKTVLRRNHQRSLRCTSPTVLKDANSMFLRFRQS